MSKDSLSVSEAKKKDIIPNRERFLNAFAYYDLRTGKLAKNNYSAKTYKEIINESGDIEKYTKLFNKLYNNTFASTGPYTMDMFVYNRTIKFKARKRIQVVSTFPNLGPSASYPLTNIVKDQYHMYPLNDYKRYFEYKKLSGEHQPKLTILEYIFRKLFKSPQIGTTN
jgi:hypothetical protein